MENKIIKEKLQSLATYSYNKANYEKVVFICLSIQKKFNYF